MLRKEEKKLLKDEYHKEKETLIVLNGFSLGGASKTNKNAFWTKSETSIANLDSNNNIVNQKLRFIKIGENTRDINLKFEDLTVYEVECHKNLNNDKLYYVLNYKKSKKHSSLFADIINEKNKPVEFTFENIVFSLDRRLKWFEGKTTINDKQINISFHADDNNSVPETCLNTLKDFITDFDTNFKSVLSVCADELILNANDWNSDSPEEITTQEFIQRISKGRIDLDISDSYLTIYLEDDDIFWGHTIEYTKNLETQEVSATICG